MAPFRGSKKHRSTYAKQANALRAAGFHVSFKGNKKSTPQQRAAVTRLFQPISSYTEKHGFFFKPVAPRLRKKLKGNFSSQEITPGGVFIQRPLGVSKKDFKVSITKKNGVVIKGKNYRDERISLNPEKLATDPVQAVKDALGEKKPVFVKLLVNGFESRGDAGKDLILKEFFKYWEQHVENMMSDDPNDRERGGRPMTADEVADIFHLKLMY